MLIVECKSQSILDMCHFQNYCLNSQYSIQITHLPGKVSWVQPSARASCTIFNKRWKHK